MINITREDQVPQSLSTPEIQKYIEDLQEHLTDPENIPKPKVTEGYRNSDLLEAFDRCFFQKCYLTEQKFPNSYCMDVEHFISKSEEPDKRYEWTNLYPADHKANTLKPRKTPNGGYLDPCDPNHDVENEILYSLGPFGQHPSFQPRDSANVKAVNTCDLLDRIHNGHDVDTKQSTAAIRNEIFKKYHHILLLIMKWQHEPVGTALKHQYGVELKMHLSRQSSFTMLMRSMVPVLLYIPQEFLNE